ncbi:MAG: hypothetical protein QNJ61_12595 [Desulfobacterales bacterium]|nr:hypothetical protein [Desulfobacterales bacterium]
MPYLEHFTKPSALGFRPAATWTRQPIWVKRDTGAFFGLLCFDELVKGIVFVMLVPDQVRDDVSGIQIMLELLASDFRQNDKPRTNSTSCETIFSFPRKQNKPILLTVDEQAGRLIGVYPEKVDFGSGQGCSPFKTAGVVRLHRGFQQRENVGLGP